MQEMHPKLNEVEVEFLVKLDVELEKVDSFYLDREKEVKDMYGAPYHIQTPGSRTSCLTSNDRLTELKRQLQELKDHRKFFFQVFPLLYVNSPRELTLGQQSKVEDRRLHFPLNFISSSARSDTPQTTTTTDSRFGAVEFRRANKDLRKAVHEHYKLNVFRSVRLLVILTVSLQETGCTPELQGVFNLVHPTI